MLVYYFTKAEYALSNISMRRLKVAELSKLNDPFEWAAPAFNKKSDRWAMRDTKREMGRQYGILCFSEDWRNPVQWSHYADHHRGVCLGFEIADEYLRRVAYAPERPVIDSLEAMSASRALTETWMQAAICTKFSHWAYEQERRVFVPLAAATKENGLYFWSLDKDIRLMSVIVGSESEVTRADVATALGDMADVVSSVKARLAFQTFEVCEQLNAKRWL